jgi:type II secretion system protein G
MKSRGFTLVEILVVIIVLGILAAIVVPQASSARVDARNGAREGDMNNVAKALDMYANDFGIYPISPDWSGDCPAYGGKAYEGPNAYIPNLSPTYIKVLPRDPNPRYPRDDFGYVYRSDAGGTNYKLLAHRTPEDFSTIRPLVDPRRPTYAWAIFTPGARMW